MINGIKIAFRIAAMVTLFAVGYYVGGYRLVYFLLTDRAKSEAQVAIKAPHAELKTLTIGSEEYNELKWTEGNKEFSYNGDLYDIVSSSIQNGQHIIVAYCDKNESQWVKALNNFTKQLFPADSRPEKNAENISSVFHKDTIPLNAMRIVSPDATLVAFCSGSHKICGQFTDKGIWHPPACC